MKINIRGVWFVYSYVIGILDSNMKENDFLNYSKDNYIIINKESLNFKWFGPKL